MSSSKKRKPGPIASRLPRRYKKGGKEMGSFFIRIDGKDVNLRTDDAEEALRRTKLARQGKRDFTSDGGARAANAVVAGLTGTDDAKTSPVVEPPPAASPVLTPTAAPPSGLPPVNTPAAALPPISSSSSGPSTPPADPVRPDGYIPPPTGWADAVSGAAGASEGSAAEEAEGLEDVLTPDMLDELLGQAADVVVNAQIWAQAFVARKGWVIGVRVKMGEVPDSGPSAKGRELGRKFWVRCFKKLVTRYMPDLELPDWLVAPVLVASLTLPVQLAGAEIIPDDGKTEETPATPGAAA